MMRREPMCRCSTMTEVVCPGPVPPGTHPAFSFGAATETAAQRKCGSTEATSHKFKYFSSINNSAGKGGLACLPVD